MSEKNFVKLDVPQVTDLGPFIFSFVDYFLQKGKSDIWHDQIDDDYSIF